MKSSQINHGMGSVEQLAGNTVGQEGLANTGVAIKKEIPGLFIEMVNEIVAGGQDRLHILPWADAETAVFHIRIITDVKGVEILTL